MGGEIHDSKTIHLDLNQTIRGTFAVRTVIPLIGNSADVDFFRNPHRAILIQLIFNSADVRFFRTDGIFY